LYEQTQRSPIVIPVVNVIGGRSEKANNDMHTKLTATEMVMAAQQLKLRKKLPCPKNNSAASPKCANASLNQDARVD
jgi:hypothetical protein